MAAVSEASLPGGHVRLQVEQIARGCGCVKHSQPHLIRGSICLDALHQQPYAIARRRRRHLVVVDFFGTKAENTRNRIELFK